MDDDARVLLLPGWLNSGPGHWQSRWQELYACERVEQADWVWPRRGDWMARLDETLLAETQPGRPVRLAAHSLGCHLVAAWAAHSRHSSRVAAALLVAPPDLERDTTPPQLAGWRRGVRQALPFPFPSLVVMSDDDPFCTAERAREMAADWGAAALNIGAAGHINADSGLGDWPAALDWLRRLPELPAAAKPALDAQRPRER